MNTPNSVRIDKWLWAVRVYKTRSQSTDGCRSGHVKIDGLAVKPAHDVRLGQVIEVTLPELTKTVKVLGFLDQRLSAAAVKVYAEDLTPPSEYQKKREPELQPMFVRAKGMGRPTKKDRRELEKLL